MIIWSKASRLKIWPGQMANKFVNYNMKQTQFVYILQEININKFS